MDEKQRNSDHSGAIHQRTLLLIPALGLFIILGVILGYGIIDDSYISLRYAQHLIEGKGLVFNEGEYVEGYTNLLWTLLLAMPFIFQFNPSAWTVSASILCGMSAIFSLHFLSRTLRKDPLKWKYSIMAPAALALQLPFICYSFSGMETSFYSFLLIISSIFFLKALAQQQVPFMWLSSIFISLAFLARPETPILFLFHLLFISASRFSKKKGSFLLSYSIPFIITTLTLTLWRTAYYGEILPNTYYAKVGHFSFDLFATGLDYIWSFSKLSLMIFILPVPFLFKREKGKGPFLYLAGLILSFLLAVAMEGGDHLAMYRFAVPIIPFICLFYQECSWNIIGSILGRGEWTKARFFFILLLTLVLSFSSSGLYFISMSKHGMTEHQRASLEVELAQMWSHFGKWLRHHYNPERKIALYNIGAIAFYSRLRVIDMRGLTDRYIGHLPIKTGEEYIGHEKYDNGYILGRSPDIILPYHIVEWDFPVSEEEYKKRLYFGPEQRLVERMDFKKNYCFKLSLVDQGTFYAYYKKCSSPHLSPQKRAKLQKAEEVKNE